MISSRNRKSRIAGFGTSKKNRRRRSIPRSVIAVLCIVIAAVGIQAAFGTGIESTGKAAKVAVPVYRTERMAAANESDIISDSFKQDSDDSASPVSVAEPEVGEPELSTAPPAFDMKPAVQSVETGARLHKSAPAPALKTDLGIKPKASKPAKAEVKNSSKPRHAANTEAPAKETPPVVVTEKTAAPVVETAASEHKPIPSFENTQSGGEPEENPKVASAKTKEAPVWRTLLSVFVNLLLVVVLAYVSILALKWFMSQRQKPSTQSGSGLKLVETVNLGANKALHVVECSGKRLILASTPNQVNLITESDVCVEQTQEKGFETYLQNSVAEKSQIDSAAMRVGQALRDGAASLLKRANQAKSSWNKGDDEKYA